MAGAGAAAGTAAAAAAGAAAGTAAAAAGAAAVAAGVAAAGGKSYKISLKIIRFLRNKKLRGIFVPYIFLFRFVYFHHSRVIIKSNVSAYNRICNPKLRN